MVIIYINFVELESSILHAKFQDHTTFGTGEDFKSILPYLDMVSILIMRPGPFIQTLLPFSHGGST